MIVRTGVLMLAARASVTDAAGFTKSLGVRFVRIEPGRFPMGPEDGNWGEPPVHVVVISRPVRDRVGAARADTSP